MTIQERFIEAAMQQVGAPYIWGGKGTHLFDKVKGLVSNPYIGNDYGRPPLLVFDCSGLVTWALLAAIGTDMRGQWNAQALREALPAYASDSPYSLRYYGKDADSITHVAIAIRVGTRYLVVEAAGGDQRCTTVLEAERLGARVRCGFERRVDAVASTELPG